MLFTSAAFALLFLPIAFAGFFLIARWSQAGAATWLFLASLFFYGYWMPQFTLLLLASICANFFIGLRIARLRSAGAMSQAKAWLIAGIVFDLALLGYFKYANFFVDNLNLALGTGLDIGRVVLPIGISFFTFTQIAFLADAYQKGVSEYKFSHYGLFVTYFPHLVAGPVLHHAQMMPQFQRDTTYRIDWANVAGGLVIFGIGLFKKIVIADGISPYADAIFDAAEQGSAPTFEEAWIGALAYTFQLYFDFSGYSDMAVGLSWMFNVRLPYNFNSPYKATNISDFWRRWHMSLSTFLRDYLYIPLGGNRHGQARRYAALMTTMLLGGLWHGASWTFVFWGGLHGIYLVVNHAFRALTRPWRAALESSRTFAVVSLFVTFVAVVVAWVFFRAHSFSGASTILASMASPQGAGGLAAVQPLLWNAGLSPATGAWMCVVLGAIAFVAPNSNAIGESVLRACRDGVRLRHAAGGAAVALCGFFVLINEARDAVSAFIYFNF